LKKALDYMERRVSPGIKTDNSAAV
jgi:hypothetical protein